jgi:hypothetical protein
MSATIDPSKLNVIKLDPRQVAKNMSASLAGLSNPFGAEAIEAPELVAEPFPWTHWSTLPKRQWIYDKFLIRGYVSLTVATGGVGKSVLSIVEALSIATGRALLDKPVYERTNTWIFNLEDSKEELAKRIMGACKRHGITREEIDGRFFVNSGLDTPLVIAQQTKAETVIIAPVVDSIIAQIKANKIGVLVVDPFVSSHQVSENDNGAIDLVAKKWAAIANETKCAIHLIHHSRKTAGKGDVDVEDARGASALLATARAARVLNTMSTTEAEKLNLVETRFQYVRMSDGKANLAPMSGKADWFMLDGVNLDNPANDSGNQLASLETDWVGVPIAWTWPETQNVGDDDKSAILEHLAQNGPWKAHHSAENWAGVGVLDALGLDHEDKAAKARAKAILKDFINSGYLEEYRDTCKETRKPNKPFIRVVDHAPPQ